jgi:hypothetical protein
MLPPFTCIYQAFGQDLGKIWARFKPSLKHQEGTISAVHCYQDSHPIFAVHARFVPIRATFQDRADRRTDNRKTLWPLAAFKALAFKSRTTQALPNDQKIGQIARRQTGHCELAGNLDALRESMNGLIEVLEQQIDHFHGGTKMVQDQFPASGKLIGGLRAEKGHDHERGESNERTEQKQSRPGLRTPPRRERARSFGAVRRAESCQYRAGRALSGYRADDCRERQEKSGWGRSVVENLFADLRREFAGVAGFSVQTSGTCAGFIWNTVAMKNSNHWLEKLPGLTIV